MIDEILALTELMIYIKNMLKNIINILKVNKLC